jgi:outer membrane protein OmpA-like peptidoglycan-associated protein
VKIASPGDVTLYFDFDNDFFSLHVTVVLTNLAKHVAETKPSRVEVTGFRAATRLSNGQVMTEREPIGSIRARKVADTLAGLGVPASLIVVSAAPQAQPADGVNDPWNRRVEIRVR